MLDALRQLGPGVRAVAVTDPRYPANEIKALHRRGRARLALQRGRPARRQERGAGRRCCATSRKRIAPFGWHIELLVNVDEADGFRPRAWRDIPVPVVLGHLGYPKAGRAAWTQAPAFADLLRLLDGGPMLDQAHRSLSHHRQRRRALCRRRCRRRTQLVAAAPQRLIWGTDWPHVMKKKRMANDGDMADLMERWVPGRGHPRPHPGRQSGRALRLRAGRKDRVTTSAATARCGRDSWSSARSPGGTGSGPPDRFPPRPGRSRLARSAATAHAAASPWR